MPFASDFSWIAFVALRSSFSIISTTLSFEAGSGIISEETSAAMREILKGVVETNKSSNCYIPGYSIGGKSGTSQKLDENAKGDTYVGSYCAFAPAEDPEIIMLVLVDHPTGEQFYGSMVAAPICQEVLSEVLPYMGMFPNYTEEELVNTVKQNGISVLLLR